MGELIQFVIYDSPRDYPGKWVNRRWTMRHGALIPGPAYICDSLQAAREHVPSGLVRIARQTQDDPAIKEMWL